MAEPNPFQRVFPPAGGLDGEFIHRRSAPPTAAPPPDMASRQAAPSRALSLRVVAVDKAQRLVELVATSEAVDSFGTRFSYEASKDAFARALGNVREMHQDIAVGNIVRWEADDAQRQIRVWVYVSEGAPDTWTKVLDGTLKGGSIGASNVQWSRAPDGKPLATRYDLVEFSLVDNPSNPDCRIIMVRMGDGNAKSTNPEAGRQVHEETRRFGGQVMPTQHTQPHRPQLQVPAQRGALPPGAIPAQQLDPPPAPIGDVVLSANQSSQGKLVIATSTDPKAPDYGVPPLVGARVTPFADGQGGNLPMTVTTGGFFTGGHPTQGASLAAGQDPMPETDLPGDYSVLAPIFDEMTPVLLNPYQDQLRPTNNGTPGQPVTGVLQGGFGSAPGKGRGDMPQTARAPQVVQTANGPALVVPPGHQLLRDQQGNYLITRDGGADISGAGAYGDTGIATGTGTASGDAGATGATGSSVAMSVSPQWHRVAASALHHAAGIMTACGCPNCTQMAAKARTMRDAFAADAAADSFGDTTSSGAMGATGATGGTASAAARPQQHRGATADGMAALAYAQAQEARSVQAFAQLSQVLTNLTERVDQIGAQPVTGGPVAMATRGFQGMDVDGKTRVLTDFAQRSNDPSVQMEAAAAILQLQRPDKF